MTYHDLAIGQRLPVGHGIWLVPTKIGRGRVKIAICIRRGVKIERGEKVRGGQGT